MPYLPAWGRNVQLKELEKEWGVLYETIFGILSDTSAVILPLGDIKRGQPDATTFTTRSLIPGTNEFTFTWQGGGGPYTWDTPLDLTDGASYQGCIPFIDFNGTDEEADSPDAAYWSNDDDADNPWSIGAWVNPDTISLQDDILTKDDAGANTEWRFALNAGAIQLRIVDNSAGNNCFRTGDAAITAGVWTFVAATYDSTGGASAADGIKLYKNGAIDASTATNDSGYVGMENLAGVVALGKRSNGANWFDGKIAGGPLGPFFVNAELSPDQIARMYEVGRRALAL